MILKLKRKIFTPVSTSGELYVDEVFFCYTLEDRVRLGDIFAVKVPKETAIPAGTYAVVMDYSVRHQKRMLHILDVPNFTGIRFDIANEADEIEGCIAVGDVPGHDFVGGSRAAWERLMARLKAPLENGEKVMITITNEGNPLLPEGMPPAA